MENFTLGECAYNSKDYLAPNHDHQKSSYSEPREITSDSLFNLNSNKLRWPGYLERLSILKLQRDETAPNQNNAYGTTTSNVNPQSLDSVNVFGKSSGLDININDQKFENSIPTNDQVAQLFNEILFPMRKILPSDLLISRVGSALTNLVYEITLINPPLQNPNRPLPPIKENVSGSGNIYPATLLPSKYLLRVYGVGVDEMLDRSKELFWLNFLGILGIGARILGLFSNGRLEEYLESKTLLKSQMIEADISIQIAKRMCELHRLSFYIPPIRTEKNNSFSTKDSNSILDSAYLKNLERNDCEVLNSTIGKNLNSTEIKNYYELINSTNSKIKVDSSSGVFKLSNEEKFLQPRPELIANIEKWSQLVIDKIDILKRLTIDSRESKRFIHILETFDSEFIALTKKYIDFITSKYSSNNLVFAHNDLQYGNILKIQSTNELMFIDFEYAGYNYRGADIANHFTEWMADYGTDQPHVLFDSKFPSKNQRIDYYTSYLETEVLLKNFIDETKLKNADYSDIIDFELIKEQAEQLDSEVLDFVPGLHLQWGLWGLIQACLSGIDFDYLEFGFQRIERFIKMFN
ncbi:putative choline kinase 2 [Smittium culicis]|uniref:Putative choline kinase 2 n=1 Tax=Smittium culicis TaxID=133412 RepID=A0A1R1XTS8_9FUNG|nr:putative choline kinase 2 [Smittium culicis]